MVNVIAHIFGATTALHDKKVLQFRIYAGHHFFAHGNQFARGIFLVGHNEVDFIEHNPIFHFGLGQGIVNLIHRNPVGVGRGLGYG